MTLLALGTPVQKRVWSAIILGPLVIIALLRGGWLWGALLGGIAVVATEEFYDIIRAAGRHPIRPLGWLLALALTASAMFPSALHHDRAILAIGIIGAFVIQILLPQAERSASDWMATLAGPIYIGVLTGYGILLRDQPGGVGWTLLLVSLVWANDTVAYLGGRLMGHTPFFPEISPKKTTEGALAGTVGTLVMSLFVPTVVGWLAPDTTVLGRVPLWQLALVGLLVAVAAPAGDLAESFLKRQMGVKDAGQIIPGHGGVWDRIDSMLFAAPVVYLATLVIVGR